MVASAIEEAKVEAFEYKVATIHADQGGTSGYFDDTSNSFSGAGGDIKRKDKTSEGLRESALPPLGESSEVWGFFYLYAACL